MLYPDKVPVHPAGRSIYRTVVASGLALLAGAVAADELGVWLRAESVESDTGSLRRAHQIHPRDTRISIQLALELEAEADTQGAEDMLQEAAALDRQFLPAWTLANFYFRQENPERFWSWARLAVERAPGDLRPVLRLAAQIESDPIQAVYRLGLSSNLLRAQLDELIRLGKFEPAVLIGQLLDQRHDPADRLRLLELERRLSSERSLHPALSRSFASATKP